MGINKIKILSTAQLPEGLVSRAAEEGISVKVLPFIGTEPIDTIETHQEIGRALLQSGIVVFTSKQAVDAVAAQMDEEQPDWTIFCTGNTTRKEVEIIFGKDAVAGTADDAAGLAHCILEEADPEELIFFCGTHRRDELPEKLRDAGVEVYEIPVYQTIETPKKISDTYHGLLFFSPSAVHSFFSLNRLEEKPMIFAIGNTTASAVKKYTDAKIITATHPGKAELVEKMIDYFVKSER
jgi:uroporphyrinogen-III synthase